MQTTNANTAAAAEARAQRFQELVEVARGTPMGTLLRQFWHPVALSRNVKPGTAQPIRIGEYVHFPDSIVKIVSRKGEGCAMTVEQAIADARKLMRESASEGIEYIDKLLDPDL